MHNLQYSIWLCVFCYIFLSCAHVCVCPRVFVKYSCFECTTININETRIARAKLSEKHLNHASAIIRLANMCRGCISAQKETEKKINWKISMYAFGQGADYRLSAQYHLTRFHIVWPNSSTVLAARSERPLNWIVYFRSQCCALLRLYRWRGGWKMLLKNERERKKNKRKNKWTKHNDENCILSLSSGRPVHTRISTKSHATW